MIQEEHRQTLNSLRNQLDIAELEIDRLHASRAATATPVIPLSPDPRDMTAADYPRELRVEERQSGEVCSSTIFFDVFCFNI